MNGFGKILVAVDGSDSSNNAFRQACSMAREDGGAIAAVTAVPSLGEDSFATAGARDRISALLDKEGGKALEAVKQIAEEEGVKLETFSEVGSPLDVIGNVADRHGFNLVVMGRKGMKRLERALVGSSTARVIGHSKKDVLVVQREAKLRWQRILLAVDGSPFGDAAAERAMELAKRHGSTLRAICAVDIPDEAPELSDELDRRAKAAIEAVKARAASAGVNMETAIKDGDAWDVIVQEAENMGAGAIVMGSHGRTGLMRLLMGSTAEKVIGHTERPVLVVRAKSV
ncbi:MAG: universal stress protein [Nitrospirae bacterium]|nr:universal stress protein [Nitrospirota bacterium]